MGNNIDETSGETDPKKVSIMDLLKPKPEGTDKAKLDEADGAMFSRVSSNLDRIAHDQNTDISNEVTPPFDGFILPISFKPISAKPTPKLSPKPTTKQSPKPSPKPSEGEIKREKTLPRDEIDTSDVDSLSELAESADFTKDRDGLLRFNFNKGPGTCQVDHASFKRKPTNSDKKPTKFKLNDSDDNVTADESSANKVPFDDYNDTEAGEGDSTRTPLQFKEVEDQPDEQISPFLPIHVLSLLFPLASVVVFLADIGTDIQLAVSYKRKGSLDLFYATLGCIIVPSIIMAAVDLSWMWIDRKNSKGGNCGLVCRIVLGALSFGRIIRAFYHMHHIYRKKTGPNKSWHRHRALEHKRDCYMLDFINAFAESCPQLFVQMYLLHRYDLPMEFIRVMSLLTSWTSIAWAYASYYRCSREALSGRQDVDLFGFILFFLSVLAALAPRVICIVLFLLYIKPWIGTLLLSIHYLIMLAWIVQQKPKLEGTTNSCFGRFMYELLFAYVSMMCFMNLKDSRARVRMVVFYLIIYAENCIMAALVTWRMFTQDEHTRKPLNFLALPVGFVIHVTFLSLYYQCLHPITGRHKRSNDNEQA